MKTAMNIKYCQQEFRIKFTREFGNGVTKMTFQKIGMLIGNAEKILNFSSNNGNRDLEKLNNSFGYVEFSNELSHKDSYEKSGFLGMELRCDNPERLVKVLTECTYDHQIPCLAFMWPDDKTITVVYEYLKSAYRYHEILFDTILFLGSHLSQIKFDLKMESTKYDYKFKLFHDGMVFIDGISNII